MGSACRLPTQYQLALHTGCMRARSRAPHCSVPRLKLRARTQSTERAWYNWGETGLCMPHVTDAWTPRVYFRHAPAPAHTSDVPRPCARKVLRRDSACRTQCFAHVQGGRCTSAVRSRARRMRHVFVRRGSTSGE